MPKWTNEQQLAIDKEGTNIIVSAGAGSGKTAVLSERVIENLKSGMSIKEILLLTFTKAASLEMKTRIRNKIKKNIKSKAKSHADKVQVTFHTLRHTFATRAIEQGMEIPVLSKILGHADISTTLNKYCHAIPDRKRENMEKIECLYDDSLDDGI